MYLRKIFFVLLFLMTLNSFAAKRYWVGTGANKNWNSTTNWSTTSGGGSGASVPGSSDTAYFNGSGTGQCSINATVSVKRWEVASGYTDTIKQNTYAITIGTSGMVVSAGVFSGGNAAITDNGLFTLSGCNFKSTSASFKIYGDYTFSSGTFSHNNGEVHFAQSQITITGSTTFYDLIISPNNSGTYTIASGTILTCNHLFKTQGTAGTRINTGTIYAKGDLSFGNTYSTNASYYGGNATIIINGTVKQTLTGNSTAGAGPVCNIEISKTSDTLVLKDYINVAGDWKYTQGILNTTSYSSTVVLAGNATARNLTGKHTLKNLSLLGGATSSTTNLGATDTITVTGDFSIDGTNITTVNNGVIVAKGNVTVTNSSNSKSGGGSTLLLLNSTSNQIITGTSSASLGRLCKVTINKSSGTVTLKDYVTLGDNADWKLLSAAGTLDATTYSNTLILTNGTRTVQGKQTLKNLWFSASGSTSVFNITSGDTITVTGTLKVEGANAVTINTGQIKAKGDITITNTSSAVSTSTATIRICGTTNQTFTGSGTALLGKICNIVIDKPSDTLKLSSIITYVGDWTFLNGIVNSGASTVIANGTTTLKGANGTNNYMMFNHFKVYNNNSCQLNATLVAKGDIIISTGATLNGNSKQIYVGGNWDNTGTFTYANTTVNFTDTTSTLISGRNQRIIKSSGTVTFHNVKINKSSKKVYLDCPVNINNILYLTKGVLVTTTTNILTIPNGGSVYNSIGSDTSYIAGPMKKIGNTEFSFPLGDTTLTTGAYHPLSITAPSTTSDAFTARYYASFSATDTAVVDSIELCKTEYWTIARNVGSSNVLTRLGWNSNNCLSTNTYDMVVSGWDGTKWKSLEGCYITINGLTGGVKGTITPVWSGTNPVGITVARKKAINIVAQIREPYCVTGATTGHIFHTITYGAPPFTYSWAHGPTIKNISDLNKGNYTLTITDRYARTYVNNYTLDNCVSWPTPPGTVTNDTTGTFTKTSGGGNWENTIVQSTKIIDSLQVGEWLKFTVADTLSNFYIGFGAVVADSLVDQTNFMLYVDGKKLTVIESDNDGFYSKTVLNTIAKDDVLKIELNEEGMKYYKNDVLVHTGKMLSNVRMQYTANIYGQNDVIKKIRCSNN